MFFFLMIRRPPRSTRTDTLFPYTTLFRSSAGPHRAAAASCVQPCSPSYFLDELPELGLGQALAGGLGLQLSRQLQQPGPGVARGADDHYAAPPHVDETRTVERRVGQECVSKGRSRRSPFQEKKNKRNYNNIQLKK